MRTIANRSIGGERFDHIGHYGLAGNAKWTAFRLGFGMVERFPERTRGTVSPKPLRRGERGPERTERATVRDKHICTYRTE